MRYVIYRKSDTKIMEHPKTGRHTYQTPVNARTALTKMLNNGWLKGSHEDYEITDDVNYGENIERFVEVKNLMSGKMVRQSVNTPLCCDVSSETYWSM